MSGGLIWGRMRAADLPAEGCRLKQGRRHLWPKHGKRKAMASCSHRGLCSPPASLPSRCLGASWPVVTRQAIGRSSIGGNGNSNGCFKLQYRCRLEVAELRISRLSTCWKAAAPSCWHDG